MELSKNYFEQLGKVNPKIETIKKKDKKLTQRVRQCQSCFTVYDTLYGDVKAGISAGTIFKDLPENYVCSVCESTKTEFKVVELQINSL